MGFALIICRSPNIRRFYVDNLRVRGHAAIGIAGLREEGDQLMDKYPSARFTPELVLMWGELSVLEPDIEKIRQSYTSFVPIIVVSREKPAPEWMTEWSIAAHYTGLSDGRELMDFLQLWLKSSGDIRQFR